MTYTASQPANILIVDDNINDLNLLTNLLINRPYKLRRAILPSLALDAIQAAVPDLVLLDVTMPEMSGYEVCQRLKADDKTRHIPIIFISASDTGIDKEKAFRCGGSDYISKPYQVEEVLARIENQLKLQQSYHTLQQQNKELENTLSALRQTQHTLLDSERQATLGRIVNRITSDIAQPIGLIHANMTHIMRQCQDIQDVIELYEANKLATLKITDLFFLKADIKAVGKLSESVHSLSAQVENSVSLLQTLFKVDGPTIQEIDLNSVLDTILLALERLWHVTDDFTARIIKKYDSLDLIEGNLNSLIQAIFLILNLVTEILALSLKNSSDNTDNYSIKIETLQLNQSTVQLTIYHNGLDLSERLNCHLQDPLKINNSEPYNQLCQGFYIIHQVILNKWQGMLYCEASEGDGMVFVFELPTYPTPV